MLDELKKLRQWVAYSHTKVPITPGSEAARPAKSTDPSTWGSYAEALYTAQVHALAGVGFVLTDSDPYVVVDLDGAVEPGVGIKPWAQEIVDALNSYTEVSPGGAGLHIWCRGAIPRRGARVRRDDGALIEIYAAARYMTVTERIVPGLTSIRERHAELAQLWDRVAAARDEGGEGGGVVVPGLEWEHPELDTWLGEALACIPADDYDTWVRVGLALKSHGEGAWAHFRDWSATSSKYDGEQRCRRKWDGFTPDGSLSIATVAYLAGQHGFVMPDARIVLPPGFDDGWDAWIAEESQHQQGAAPPEVQRLRLRWIDAAAAYLDDTPPEPDLVAPGVLAPGDLMVLFGPPKSMKSMLLLDMCTRWAQGRAWLQLEPARALTIAMAQFEIREDRMRARLQAKRLGEGELRALRGRLLWTDRFTPHLGAQFVETFAASLAEVGVVPDVLVIDPLANLFSGDDENSNAQMTRFLREVYVLRNTVNPRAALVLVHHARKSGAGDDKGESPFGRLRGAGALRGAYDTGVYCDWLGGGGVLGVHWELRNAASLDPMRLQYSGETGRFVEVTQEAGAIVLMEWLVEHAAGGRVYSKAQAVKGAAGVVGMEPKALGGMIKGLVDDGTLVLFQPDDVVGGVGVPEPHAKSHGWLGVPGMQCYGGEVRK